jgi:hypothetical protein
MLFNGHRRARVNAALAAEPGCVEDSSGAARQPSNSLREFLTHTTTPKGRSLLFTCRQWLCKPGILTSKRLAEVQPLTPPKS